MTELFQGQVNNACPCFANIGKRSMREFVLVRYKERSTCSHIIQKQHLPIRL